MIGPTQLDRPDAHSTMYAVSATRMATHPNSYMLPHGTRSAASPRVTTPASSTSQVRTVSENPMPPATSDRPSAISSGDELGAPAPTSSRSGATLRAKPHCARRDETPGVPISRVRCATPYATAPYNPAAASESATIEKNPSNHPRSRCCQSELATSSPSETKLKTPTSGATAAISFRSAGTRLSGLMPSRTRTRKCICFQASCRLGL